MNNFWGGGINLKTKWLIAGLSIFVVLLFITDITLFRSRQYTDLAGARLVLPNGSPSDLYKIDINWTSPDALTLIGLKLPGQLPIYVVDIPSQTASQITTDGENSHWYNPSVSPDGKLVAIHNMDVGHLQILKNENPWQLVLDVPVPGYTLEWSQDGSRVAILDYEKGKGYTLTIFNLGSRQSLEEHHFVLDDIMLQDMMAWSEDLNEIAIQGSQKVSKSDGSYDDIRDLYLFSLSTDTITRLTDTPNITEGYPEWISDGILAYSVVELNKVEEEDGELQLNDVQRGCVRTIEGIHGFYSPSWSPDRKEMAFIASNALYMIPFENILGPSVDINEWVCQTQ